MKKVLIMRGLPGSGKSWYAKKLREENDSCIICSTDDYFMVEDYTVAPPVFGPLRVYKFDPFKLPEYHQKCLNFFLGKLYLGRFSHDCPLIIVDNTNIHIWEYRNYEDAARMYGYEVEIVEFRANTIEDVKLCISRNTHRVPADIIARHAIEFEHDDRATVMPIKG